MRHTLWMLIGCVVPIVVLLVLLPVVGLDGRWWFLVLALAMLGCHLFMLGGHEPEDSSENGGTGHEHA